LSGGQRQRLALARALTPGPAVVLLDEPFSNLDVEVRLRLRSELPAVLDQCGACGLLVTHDPEEALAICDRVAVLRDGQLHQCASPRELVQAPATPFVGQFVLQANLIPVQASADGRIDSALGSWQHDGGGTLSCGDDGLTLLINPEVLLLHPDPNGAGVVQGREFLGREWMYQVQLGPLRLRLRLPLEHDWPRGQRCSVQRRPGAQALLYPGRIPLKAL
ncbi:MAG: ABC transporter ATP-binding protein, partial [Cyanobacteria bacterium K_DeepCast_35m_m2_023]|nr:ABC transporter ATP-binding protein [Cyanobacteria bacterium K_DeepCast_35m_m2_023]